MTTDDLARLSAGERSPYFTEAAANLGTLRGQLIEKDFWVCWLLRRLFELREIGPYLTLKGGTSLSKAYAAIDRFSEDVDLAVERGYLGFGGEKDPGRAASKTQREKRLEELGEACRRLIADTLLPMLRQHIASVLPEKNWILEVASDDPDGQSILFAFPQTELTGTDSYFRPSIKLDLEPRADHDPAEVRIIRPYVDDALSGQLSDPVTSIRVLHINRTYWEKATILHMLAHKPEGAILANGMSRHYYDLYRLADHPDSANAIENTQLLRTVAGQKAVYFRSAQAKYETARPGSMRLVPDEYRVTEMASDYAAMQPMFFGRYPGFVEVIERLRELEKAINLKTT